MLIRALNWLFDMIFPGKCGICGILSPAKICGNCSKGITVSVSLEHGVITFSYYTGPVRKAFKRIKYGRDKRLCTELADRLLMKGHIPHADLIVPVPLHPKRLRERGFNQSDIIAYRLSEISGIPVSHCLLRKKDTQRQFGLSKERRAENVKKAFSSGRVPGGSVILVDDIYTTGATTSACSHELLLSGATRVKVLCLSRAKLV